MPSPVWKIFRDTKALGEATIDPKVPRTARIAARVEDLKSGQIDRISIAAMAVLSCAMGGSRIQDEDLKQISDDPRGLHPVLAPLREHWENEALPCWLRVICAIALGAMESRQMLREEHRVFKMGDDFPLDPLTLALLEWVRSTEGDKVKAALCGLMRITPLVSTPSRLLVVAAATALLEDPDEETKELAQKTLHYFKDR